MDSLCLPGLCAVELIAEGDIASTLGIQPVVVLAQVIGFVLLFLVLKKFLFTRLVEHMERRKEEIRSTFDQIERSKAEVAKLTQEYQAKLAGIQKEAYEAMQKAIGEANTLRAQMMAEAQKKSQEEFDRRMAEFERERQKAVVALRQEVVRLSLAVAEKLVDQKMDAATHGQLADKFINEVGAAK